jgi:hypothetical protein
LRRCRRRAHQLDHNAVLCYCCPCFFGLNTAICTPLILFPCGLDMYLMVLIALHDSRVLLLDTVDNG